MGRAPQKFYAVKVGRRPGVYETWAETEQQVKNFPRAVHKSFRSRAEAENFAGAASRVPAVEPVVAVLKSATDAQPDHSSVNPQVATVQASSIHAVLAAPPQLTQEQTQILNRILLGENVFFTGPAGSGKSVLLRAIVDAFKVREVAAREDEARTVDAWAARILGGEPVDNASTGRKGRHNGWKLAVTASTGMAAVNIGGCTLHSWAGVGLGKMPVDKLYESIQRNKLALKRWRAVDALIIDEISMISGSLLDTLSSLAQRLRRNEAPFGGIQIIASGDFYQLPPVPDRQPDGTSAIQTFAFEAECWTALFPPTQMISLTRIFRQSQSAFVSLLGRLRNGQISPSDIALIKSSERAITYPDGIEPVSLLASKREVADINSRKLASLEGSVQSFLSWDEPGINSRGFAISQKDAVDLLDRNTRWEKEVDLKVGALVMLLVNMQDGNLVNGSTGHVISFLRLSEALAKGIYVPDRALQGNPNMDVSWPVVNFVPPQSSRRAAKTKILSALIPQMSVTVNNAQGGAEAVRHQVPLMLAWGMTVHKAQASDCQSRGWRDGLIGQGQTIERLRVDLSKVFERGQAYVALSRATSLETLEIRGFSADKVMAHPKVIEWFAPIEERQAMDAEWEMVASGQ